MRQLSLVCLLLALCSVSRAWMPAGRRLNINLRDRPRRCSPPSPRPTTTTMAIVGPVRYASADWLICMRSLPSSRILARTRSSILAFSGWAAICFAVTRIFRLNYLLPAAVSTVLGPTLSLLLVFRTNSSYERFIETRKALSTMLVALRNIASHASVHVPPEDWPALARLLVGYAILQKQHLQGRVDSSELSAVFTPEVLREIEARNNRPLCVLQKIEHLVHTSLMNKYRKAAEAGDPYMASSPKYIEKHFIECLHAMGAQLAACERIVKQPVPLSYSRHLSRFLSFYLLLLPLSLIQPLGAWAIPMTAFIAWSLVSILEISHWIEQPMDASKQIIQLNSICSVVRNDVSELLGGALGGPALDGLEKRWLKETLANSRDEDEVRLGFYRTKALLS